MKTKCKWWILALTIILPLSCTTPSQLGYLRDMEYNVPMMAQPAPELRLKVDDRLSIQVFADEPELAAPFNTILLKRIKETTGTSLLGTTYGVDANGDIDFPVLGAVHVEGKTLREVKQELENQIIQRGYIKDPMVKVELENFTITVLGETGQRVLEVQSNCINILEALSYTGGTNQNSKIPDVMVVRTENGKRTAYTVNLQSKSLYESPAFWLQQNDVLYVKPRGVRLSSGGDLFLKIFAPTVSALSAIAYMLLWTSR